jgi:hypothetical protein
LKKSQALRRRESLPTEFRQEGIPDGAFVGFFNNPVWERGWG